ncbi:hypothetical protein ACPWT1_14940 [Ramlibacter sp. MMS24-I3-19]|uniref:hypothetical protein n=1 Tax=Ramlibacter sp. MMS24-I3-19 TaxID=3416606 RepID=UPI003D093628
MTTCIPAGSSLDLDLLRPGATRHTSGAGLLALVAASAALVLALTHYNQAADAERSREAQLAAHAVRTPRAGAATPADLRQRAAGPEMAAIEARINYPWQSLLSFLESQQQADVALLAVDPDRRTGLTKILAEAKDSTAMLTYLAALQKSTAFEEVVLSAHEVQARQPGTPVRFELLAHWKSPCPRAAGATRA